MNAIISFVIENIKSFLIGIAIFVGFLFLARERSLKQENDILNNTLNDENKALQVQNELLKTANSIKPTDINGITDLMQQDKL